MSTCLAYANRLRHHARPVFFSLTSAMEIIHAMGFEGDYLVSRFWSRAGAWDWDRQLASRLGILFEHVQPQVVVFDGTWPYRGLLHAIQAFGKTRSVWSDLTMYKSGWREVPVRRDNFDLVIRLGELGSSFSVDNAADPVRSVTIPPFTMLENHELLERADARDILGLEPDGKYALFSLGPGNLKDVSTIAQGLIDKVRARGYTVVWARAPISVGDIALPEGVLPISVYPLVRYLRAFDINVSAAGYNTCCEVLQTGVPTLFVPNTLVADDQTRRAELVAKSSPVVVSPCETDEQQASAIERLVATDVGEGDATQQINLDGADRAAEEILSLIDTP